MFLKLTDNETGADVYINPRHIIRFVPTPEAEGCILYMAQGAGISDCDENQILAVHENAEEVFRMISRHTKQPSSASGGRGLL